MPTTALRAYVVAATLAAGCASTGARTLAGPDAAIPVFAADDARVGTAGFVAETLRLHQERDGIRHTLMAFAVGDTLTLGAMVRGPFAGQVQWRVGAHTLSVPFDAAAIARTTPVIVDGDPAKTLTGEGASFRGTAWINVELPLASWGATGTSLQLTFVPNIGAPLVLPDEGYHYVVRHDHR